MEYHITKHSSRLNGFIGFSFVWNNPPDQETLTRKINETIASLGETPGAWHLGTIKDSMGQCTLLVSVEHIELSPIK